jgi:uncharacterized protein
MKIAFFSDVHGQLAVLEQFLAKPDVASATHLVDAGDFFQSYQGLDSQVSLAMAALINAHPAHKLAVWGNNDPLDMQQLFTFAVESKVLTHTVGPYTITLSHGHYGEPKSLQQITKSKPNWRLFVQGHTHVARLYVDKKEVFLNPGSLSYPRSSLPATYAILENKTLSIKTLSSGEVVYSAHLA